MTPTDHPRVLCVDDNVDIADSEADLLALSGCETRACYGGHAALTAAREFAPDVCLIDLNMPAMEGDELAARLRAEAGGSLPVLVAVTAMGNEDSRRRIAAAGFVRHLVKPVSPADLMRAVEEAWRAAGTGRGIG